MSRSRRPSIPIRRAACSAALFIAFHASAGPSTAHAADSGPLPRESVPTVLAHGAAFVAALNDSSPATWRQTVRSIYAASTLETVGEETLVAQLERLHGEYAPLELHHSEVSVSALHVFARSERAAGWKDFQFFVETAPPHGLLQLVFIAEVAEPVYLPNGEIQSAETVDWIHHYVEKLMAEDGLSGRILLARGDRPFFQRAFGYLDAAGTRPVFGATRFNLASGNKMFTAVAALMLVEEGKLRLEDPIGRYLPAFPDAELGRRITVRQLLSHSSGLGDFLPAAKASNRQTTRLAEIEPFVYEELAEHGIWFEPGTEHRYSNSGFLLLGRIIEEVTGEDYFDVIRTRIYVPLGMKMTDSYLMDGSTPDLAPALTKATAAETNPASGRAATHEDPGASANPSDGTSGSRWVEVERGLRGSSAGGGFSTPPDMLLFLRALIDGRLVSKETLAEMTRPQLPGANDGAGGFADGWAYGLGFELQRSRGGVLSWGHGGIAPGVNFSLRYFPASDITFIVFNNQDNGAYDDLRRNIVNLITGDR